MVTKECKKLLPTVIGYLSFTHWGDIKEANGKSKLLLPIGTKSDPKHRGQMGSRKEILLQARMIATETQIEGGNSPHPSNN